MDAGTLLFLLVASVLVCFGGTYPSTSAPILAASLGLFALTRHRAAVFAAPTRGLDAALLTIAAAICLQLVPLPRDVVDTLSPSAAAVGDALVLNSALRSPDAWRPLTLDVKDTLHALATFVSTVLVFWSARGVFTAGGARTFCRRLAWFGGAMSVVALAFRATSPRLLYGVWRPEATNATPFGPYVDRNLFAAWLVMVFLLTAAYVVLELRALPGVRRGFREHVRAAAGSAALPTIVCATVMLTTVALTLSRGAIVGLVSATALILPIVFKRLNISSRGAATAAGVAALVVVAMVPSALVERFQGSLAGSASATARLVIWRETLPIIGDFWFSGTGAGAFEHAMLLYQRSERRVFFNFAHNQYLQVAAEGGVLLGVATLWAVAAFARVAAMRLRCDASQRGWLRLGGSAAVVAVAVHGIWDFPIQMPGNALLFAIAAAIVVAPTPGAHAPVRRHAPRTTPPTRRLA